MIRVRFAPSPTGYLHIGGVRTALFNWLWARKTGGTFVLRIEDTDQERSTAQNTQLILDELRWLGLEWDEGPDKGGDYGPYAQMARLDIYQQYAAKLVEQGAAYRCYATKEELAAAREELLKRDPKAHFRYPGWWRDKGPADWPENQPYVLRLKVPADGHTSYDDLVFGEQSVPNSSLQDVVLMRSDGVPLYNFGCVIDDVTMKITMVGRGRDHMINTPIQVLIYQALGAPLPDFAHLPLMRGKGNEKLSKRHGAVAVGDYREQGITASGLLNYLVRFGWSFGDEEVFTLAQLVEKFDWARCNKSDGKFDAQKLSAVAFEHLKREDLTTTAQYTAALVPFLHKRFGAIDDHKLAAVLPQIRPRARTLVEAAESLDWLFAPELRYDDKAKQKFLTGEKGKLLVPLRQLIGDAKSFEARALEAEVKGWSERDAIKLGDIAQPARVALTGSTASPGIFEVMELLGRDVTLARLDAAIALSLPPALA